jgi:phospholipid/cholesterol/gamma-HCH transport system substrate-binding protein
VSGPSQRGTAIKLAVFVVVTSVLGLSIVGTLLGKDVGVTDRYHAIFADVSGLHTGDPVRVAGVVVGKVTGEKLVDASHVEVTFTANRDQQLSTSTHAVVRYANLLGQRFLALTDGATPSTSSISSTSSALGTTSAPLPHGGTIPETQTAPALSLTVLFNGFRPLFQSLNPDQVNQLSAEIVALLQGEDGTIEDLLAQTAQLTTNLAQRDSLFKGIVDGLAKLLGTVASHDSQLQLAVTSLRSLTGGLAADSPNIGASLGAVDRLMSSVGDLLSGLGTHNLHGDAIDLNALADVIARNTTTLDSTIKAFGPTFATFDVVTQSGNWINAYPCSVVAATSGTPTATPAQISTLIGDYLGGGNAAITTVFELLGGLFPNSIGLPVPLKIPTGPIGNPSAGSAACR